MRDFLRALPVLAGESPELDPLSMPSEPAEVFTTWLSAAVDAGVPEPHAMTLSTVDAAGAPDARVLILKDLDATGWWFATSRESAKGRQLAAHAAAALTFYWPQQGRQVRVRGEVLLGSAEQSAADFLSRSAGARAITVASDWQTYAVVASAVEFWQADPDRVHTRVQYRRIGADWTHGLL